MANTPTSDTLLQYGALRDGIGFADVSDRTQIELTGEDRASFLHNFCTNDIKKLSPGEGCEAFVTNVQGKILGHVLVFCGDQSLVVETVPGQAQGIISHLDRYLITEDVELHDRTAEWSQLLVAGAGAANFLAEQCSAELPGIPMGHVATQLNDIRVAIRRVELVGPSSFLVSCDSNRFAELTGILRDAGATECSHDAVEMCRIQAGWPAYGLDITEKNLPQEVGRDAAAISLTKGCYLGQETVARIDALGHVNRTLVGVAFSGDEVPRRETELMAGDKAVGHVTSAIFSPRLESPIGLAYVRREHNSFGTQLSSEFGKAIVVKLPIETAVSS